VTTQTLPQGVLADFSLLNAAAQQRLDARVRAAQGNIAAVRQELQTRLDDLDARAETNVGMTRQAYQGDRAFLLGQIAYLDALQQLEQEHGTPQREGLLSRLSSRWRKRSAAQ
jgi:hypothetical protein